MNIKEAKDKGKAFGYVLAQKKDELNKVTSKTDLVDFVKRTCGPEIKGDSEQEKYLDNMIKTINTSPFSKGLMFVYNIILKGEGLGSFDQSKKDRKKESRKADRYKHLIGKIIKIEDMEGELRYSGKKGVVEYVDDMGQLHGTWGGCAVIPETDSFKVLNEKKMRERQAQKDAWKYNNTLRN